MEMLSMWMGSRWAGGCAVFIVAAMELSFAAALTKAAAYRLGSRNIAWGAATALLVVTIATAAIYLLLDSIMGGWRRPIGGAILILLGLYLAMRFGTSRVAADGGGWVYDGIMPTPSRKHRRSGVALGRTAVGRESIKAAIAWIGVAFADDPAVASMALILAILSVAIAATRSRALTLLPPSLLYGVALVTVLAHGFARDVSVLASVLSS